MSKPISDAKISPISFASTAQKFALAFKLKGYTKDVILIHKANSHVKLVAKLLS